MKLLMGILFFTAFCTKLTVGLDKVEEPEETHFFIRLVLDALLTLNGTRCEPVQDLLDVKYNTAVRCLAAMNGTFCNVIVDHFTDCTSGLVALIESCVEPRRERIATAFVTSLVAQTSFMCNTDGEHLFEILNPCVLKTFFFEKEEAGVCMHNFIDELRSLHKTQETILTIVCRALRNVKNCIKSPFESNCPNEITRNTVEEFYNSNVRACGRLFQ